MVYIFLADGFEEIEALCPYDLMLRAGIKVKTVSVNPSAAVKGTHDVVVHADITADSLDYDVSSLELIMLPGGTPGAFNLEGDERVQKYITLAESNNKYIAAICAAPMILGKRGLLKGKNAVCYPSFEKYLEGAHISKQGVVCDGNIITAKGMGVSFDFGLKLISVLRGVETMNKVKEATMAI